MELNSLKRKYLILLTVVKKEVVDVKIIFKVKIKNKVGKSFFIFPIVAIIIDGMTNVM